MRELFGYVRFVLCLCQALDIPIQMSIAILIIMQRAHSAQTIFAFSIQSARSNHMHCLFACLFVLFASFLPPTHPPLSPAFIYEQDISCHFFFVLLLFSCELYTQQLTAQHNTIHLICVAFLPHRVQCETINNLNVSFNLSLYICLK